MPKQGGRRKKTRTHKVEDEHGDDVEEQEAPKSFILKRGDIGQYQRELLMNMRELMYPYTAMKLKESKKNSLKDFLGAAGLFGVSHMMIFTQTDTRNYMKLVKNPKGPTLTFAIDEYCLARDVTAYQQATKRYNKIFCNTLQAPPLLIMNGFGGRADSDPYRIASLMIQSMFPPIKVQSMNLSACKRIVLFNLVKGEPSEDDEDESDQYYIEFRHYGISARQRSVNRGIKRLINSKKVPDMSKFSDISAYIKSKATKMANSDGASASNAGFSSESEADDLPESRIVLPENYQDKKANSHVAIKLHELGPRLKLKLHKIQEGFCRGNVTFHRKIRLDKNEIKKQLDSLKTKRELKEKRKQVQEDNVRRKAEIAKDKELVKQGIDPEEQRKKKEEAGDDDYVSDDEIDAAAADVDDNTEVKKTKQPYVDAKKPFSNFQKKGYVPNITSQNKRPAGVSKGLWKRELKTQLTGTVQKKSRRGLRRRDSPENLGSTPQAGVKRDRKTATQHKTNTSTFKNQGKNKRQKTE